MTQKMTIETGYHTLCGSCAAQIDQAAEDTLRIKRHGVADSATCDRCGNVNNAQCLSTYRVWQASA